MKKSTFKNYLAALILIVSTLASKAQNLVVNPSFENFTPAPLIGCAGSGYGNVNNWYNPDPTDSCSTPDWYSACTTLLGATPNASFGYQTAHSGNAYAGFILKDQSTANYREYVEGKLSSPLVAGQTYCVAFHISLANKTYLYCNNFGMYLSSSLTQYTVNNCNATAPLPVTPQLNYTCTITDTTNWVRLQWNYTATGGEQYFTIGNFFNDAATTSGVNNAAGILSGPFAYYYIDDVSIAPGVCCYDSIIAPAPLCVSGSTVTLTTSEHLGTCITPTNSGVWSGTGITNTATGVFDPAVAGVGTHVVSYSLSCGYVATASIVVNACPLTVCKDGSGNYSVSGGTSPYNWSTVTSYTDCSGCPGGNCIPFFCSGVASTSLTPYASNTSTVSPPGSYPLIVSDNTGNTYTVTSSASTPTCAVTSTCTPITVSTAASNSVTCFGTATGSATVSISPAGTYTTTWQPGNLSGLSQSGLAAGTYTITADAGGGCTGTTTLTIAQPPAITTTITTTPATCNLSNGSATVSANGGTGSYTYTWTPSGGNAATASNLAAGAYTVATTDANACTHTSTVTVTTSASPTITINSTPYCTGDSTALTASGATTYSWSPSTNLNNTTTASVTATPTTTTIYTVTGTTAGCAATATISVGPLTFTVNKVNLCKGDSALLIASNSNLTYSWTPSTGLNHTNNDTVKASPTTTTVYTITATYGATCSLTVTDSVIVLTKPIITVLSPTVCSATSATITATGAATYTWAPAGNLTHSVTSDTAYVNFPTTPGTYTVFGTAANGCKDTAVSQVTISNHLGIVSGTPINSCYGDYLELVGIGASTYTWTSNNLTNLHFTHDTGYYVVADIANVGTYTIAIYGESHTGTFCNGYDTVTVMVHPTPTVTAVGPASFTICAGSSATLTATSGGASVYNWSPATGLSVSTSTATGSTVATPANSTIYTVTGSNNFGCSDAISFSVTVIPIPTFNLNSAAICNGSSATLTITPTTADATTYTWTPASTLSTGTGTMVVASPTNTATPTIYTVTATTNVAGCPSLPQTTTVTVHPLPTITVTPNSTTVCSNLTTNLSASTGLQVYNWSPASAISGPSNTATITADPSAATVYTVSGSDAFGCPSNTVTATVNVTYIAASATANAVCKGQTINLTGNTLNSATYLWTGPNSYTAHAQSPSIPNSTAANIGTYTLTVTTGTCVATSTVNVGVNPLPTITVTPTTQTICPNATATLTANGNTVNGPITYSWSPAADLSSSSGNVVTATTSVTSVYNVVGTDANGCTASANTTVNINPVTAAIAANPPSGDIPLNVQFSNTSVGGTVYAWNYGNGTATYTTTSLADINTATTYTTPGTYTVTMYASNATSCTSASYLVIVVTEGFTITIPNVFTPNGDGINDEFFVKTTGLATINMVIYDRWGLKMWESSSASGTWNGGNCSEGTYFYVIKATSTKNENKEYKGSILLIK